MDFEKKYQEIFNESALMITDFSTVAFDFAYLKKLETLGIEFTIAGRVFYQLDKDVEHEVNDKPNPDKIKEIQKLNLPKVKELSLGHEAARDGKNGKPYMEYNGTEIREIQNSDLIHNSPHTLYF